MRKLLLAGLVLAGIGLRARPLTANRFHPDEALYATFGRLIATGRDPMLADVVVDKPPVSYYALGGSMYLWGSSEFAARLPNLFASALSLPLLYVAARRLYDRATATAALVAFSLSPYPISFAATAFIDPLQLVFLLWALVEAARHRWVWAGIAAGLALATKQTTIAFVPLLLWLLLRDRNPFSHLLRRPSGKRVSKRHTLWRLAGFAAPVLLALLLSFSWDMDRQASIGFWQQGFSDNAPGRLATVAELWPRLKEIGRFLSYVTASPIVTVTSLVGLGLLLWQRRASPRWVDVTLAVFATAYVGAYWLLTFNLWDRYFLVLTPLLCILLARGGLRLAEVFAPKRKWAVLPILAVLLLPPALTASRSGYALGGDHGAYDGIDVVAQYLSEQPKGDVLYDHWLSWELRYYLDEAPIYLVWMPDPETLTTDLRAFGHTSPRYFVSPSWESDAAMQAAAGEAGFTFEPVLTTTRRDGSTSFTVYQLVPISG